MGRNESSVVALLFFIAIFLGSAFIVYILKATGLKDIHEAYLVPYWLAIIYMFVKIEEEKFEKYGFTFSVKIECVAFSATLGFILVLLALSLGVYLGIYTVNIAKDFNVTYLIIYFILILISSFGEEAVFRGYLLFKLSEALGIKTSMFIIALLFSLLHFSNPGYNILSFIQLFFGSISLSMMIVYGGSVVYPTMFHVFWNYAQTLLGFPVSGHKYEYSVIMLNYNISDSVITGGSFGLEGSVLGVTVTLLGLVLVGTFFSRCSK